MKISKSRIDYFLDKKDNEYNPNLDSFNLLAKGYNEAIRDVKKEVEKISQFEEMTLPTEKAESIEQIIMGFKYGLYSNKEAVRRIKQNFQ
ncbi:hypothetical protein M9Q43_13990 [Flavobacterium sp. HXWNR29]|uniref:hypothetical protein n=1 Tax=Flavobacterium odoriferum TaxID=2946604 RepID=UPI0021CB09F8|nr:hypothetical protein [Flavobacterium sp. HXWNR29]MCU4190271.1 hypothetical protein [Flavobacterium sp. HXWNR29]